MYHLITHLLQPYVLLLLLSALALANLWRKRQESRRRLLLLTIPFVGLFVISLPPVASFTLGTLESEIAPLKQRPSDAQAIVVLAGCLWVDDFDQVEPGVDTLYRCLKAADLYHQGGRCPILLSGGQVLPDARFPRCACVMKDFLVRLGVNSSDLIVEDQSRSTHENAVFTARLLRERGISRIVLITDAAHMQRALACFAHEGIDQVVPCGCRYHATHALSPADLLPTPSAPQGVHEAWHEWLGTVWYWCHGRI